MAEKLKKKYLFATDVKRRLKAGMPIADIQDMAKDYEGVSTIDIDTIVKSLDQSHASDSALALASRKANVLYLTIDQKFVDSHKGIVVYQRGNNVDFYQYKGGVYSIILGEDMHNIVSDFFKLHGLLEQRTSSRKIQDTIKRISSLMTFANKRRFTDEQVYSGTWYINLKNGLLDTKTNTLLPHTPDYFSMTQAPFDYDPSATCPEFEKFIATITQKNPGSDLMIQEMFGYVVGTEGNPRHKIFYLYGSVARNGKSTTVNILSGLIGRTNVSSISLEQIAGNSMSIMESIVGKQMNFSDEVSGNYLQSGRLTSIVAEGMIEISPKFKPAYLYQVRAKFVVACNSLPRFSENQGMRHRMMVIPFTYQIPESERIANYDKVLLEKEGSGILNWALKGAGILKEKNIFTVSEESKEDIDQNILQGNTVLAYIEDWFDFTPEREVKYTAEQLYGDLLDRKGYCGYCKKNGVMPVSRKKFERDLKTIEQESNKIEYNKTGTRGYIGIKLKAEIKKEWFESLDDVKAEFDTF